MASANLEIARKALVSTGVVLAMLLVCYMVFLIRGPLLWLGIAFFLAIAINPPIKFIARYMPKRNLTLATLVFFIINALILSFVLSLFLKPLIAQTGQLVGSLPEIINHGIEQFSKTQFASDLHLTQAGMMSYIESNLSTLTHQATVIGGTLVSLTVAIIDNILALVAILTLVFFMTLEGKRWKRITLRTIEPKYRAKAAEIGDKVYHIVTGYVVGNISLSIVYGVASAAVLAIMGNPYALPLGLLVGILDLIPLVGSTIGATIVTIICLLSGEVNTAVVFIIYTLAYVQLENNVLNPMVYSKSVDVSSLVVLAALLIGGAMAGIVGALVAIPVAASLQVIARELLRNRPEPD